MLHLRLRVPDGLNDEVRALLCDDETVTNVTIAPGAFVKPEGALVTADVARENAQAVLAALRRLGLAKSGSISIDESPTVMSEAATAAERAAPGTPIDAVVWDLIEDRTRDDIRLSWAFVSFLTLATMIASVGRILDQPILIVGAMVVGPEFSAIAAICFAIARPRLSLIRPALVTLVGGIAIAAAITFVLSSCVYLLGGFTEANVRSGPQTDFIVQPDTWSFVIACLAGVAGTLSLTTSKSATLVGVFISVTTVPAIGTLALSLSIGGWSEAGRAITQLSVNIAGLIIAGTLTLLIQKAAWRRIGRP